VWLPLSGSVWPSVAVRFLVTYTPLYSVRYSAIRNSPSKYLTGVLCGTKLQHRQWTALISSVIISSTIDMCYYSISII
jgi:hypothetical protein